MHPPPRLPIDMPDDDYTDDGHPEAVIVWMAASLVVLIATAVFCVTVIPPAVRMAFP